ncbi:MAG: hypothetical protein KZQ82_13040 [Candidatus Thiodiazotropha sp. (ex Lucinoma annulata)]|nr:hypothetical protein [Candidatus Thiodiazotropha sp. (ex Lucinoma annulata)]
MKRKRVRLVLIVNYTDPLYATLHSAAHQEPRGIGGLFFGDLSETQELD